MTAAATTASATAEQFHDEVSKITLSSTSTSRFNDVKKLLAPVLGLNSEDIYAAYAKRTNNVSVRLTQTSEVGPVALMFIKDPAKVDYAANIAKDFAGPVRKYGAIAICAQSAGGKWSVQRIVEAPGGTYTPILSSIFPSAVRVDPNPGGTANGATAAGAVRASNTADTEVALQIDPRIKRMARLALRTYRVIVLVGVPGTGKTTLLDELVEEAREDPASFGFTRAPKPLMKRTPEESWTARDLVGGETIDDRGRIRFRPGAVLDAIRQDRWLLLDELNRADMDRIFGPLMTWLSGQPVELGRASSAIDAPQVELRWADTPECSQTGLERLAADEIGPDPVVFAAGTEWRLLATYNPLDAQRVFRFGQALGRRLKEIPIPTATREEFSTVLSIRAPALSGPARDALVDLYSAHLADRDTQLGPAVFFDMARYIVNGLESEQLAELEEGVGGTEEEGAADASALAAAAPTPAAAGDGATTEAAPTETTADARQTALVAEAYLLNPGKYVAKYAPRVLDKLGERITGSGAIPEQEWSWIKKLLLGLA